MIEKKVLESIEEVEARIAGFIDAGNNHSELANEFRYELSEYIKNNSEYIQYYGTSATKKYNTALARLEWFLLQWQVPMIVRKLFREYFEYFFEYPADTLLKNINQMLASFIDLADRDALKKDIRDAISTSVYRLSKKQITINGVRSFGTVQNWIHDFELFADGKNPNDQLVFTQYLNTSPNVANLSSDEREKLEGLFRFYNAMGLSSLTPAGNEDTVIYHDIESGHIKYIDHGKEIDTGIESDIVAKMTPEEKEEALRDIQKRVQEFDKQLAEAEISMTPILEEQLSRSEELRREIARNTTPAVESVAVDATPVAASTPRVEMPVATPAPKAPQKVVPDMFDESVVELPVKQEVSKPSPIKPVVKPQTPVTVSPSLAAAPLSVTKPAQPVVPMQPAESTVMPDLPPIPTAAPAPIPVVPQQPITSPKPVTSVIESPVPVVAPKMQPQPKEGIDYETLAQEVLAEHALLLESVDAENRFLSLIASFAKGDRTREEVMQTLVTPIESGGVNMTADIASSCLNTAERFVHAEDVPVLRATGKTQSVQKPTPTFAQVQELMQRQDLFEETKKRQVASTVQQEQDAGENMFTTEVPVPAAVPAVPQQSTSVPVEDIFANLDVAQMRQKSVDPLTDSPIRRMDSMRPVQQSGIASARQRTIGPVEELQQFSLTELRSFGVNPEKATTFIRQKIDLQAQESIAKKAEAIRAWQTSPVHQLYVSIGNSSLSQGMPVNQYIEQAQQRREEVLSLAEFEAVAALNRSLRF